MILEYLHGVPFGALTEDKLPDEEAQAPQIDPSVQQIIDQDNANVSAPVRPPAPPNGNPATPAIQKEEKKEEAAQGAAQSPSFWQSNKSWILPIGLIALVSLVGYYAYSASNTKNSINGRLEGINNKVRKYKRKARREQ